MNRSIQEMHYEHPSPATDEFSDARVYPGNQAVGGEAALAQVYGILTAQHVPICSSAALRCDCQLYHSGQEATPAGRFRQCLSSGAATVVSALNGPTAYTVLYRRLAHPAHSLVRIYYDGFLARHAD